jgi:deazaflavin-dependent oxidoreductase (nitroreductase family)
MKDLFIKWFMAFSMLLLRVSRGRIGSKLGPQTILILHTIGRKSGQERKVPIAYFNYEGKYLIVASNWAKETNADWYLNLKKDPQARLEIKGRNVAVVAREAAGEEYERLWKFELALIKWAQKMSRSSKLERRGAGSWTKRKQVIGSTLKSSN